jgi:hypothetical protein
LVDKLGLAQGVGRHIFGGTILHKDEIFPEFFAFRSTDAGSPAAPPARTEAPAQPPAEPLNHSSPSSPRALQGRLAAPPFSWLGDDAWPHSPAWAEQQA